MSTTALFLLLILACPLMMLLMHRGGHPTDIRREYE